MKMPPFIVGAGVLFWGFQTTFEWLAVIMAAVLEGARWTPRRWRILAADVSRVWDVCLVLLLGAAVYSYTSSDITYTVLAFLQCLPMIFFPFMCALAWGGLETVSPRTFLPLLWRKRDRESGARIRVGYFYAASCILAASAANVQTNSFYAGAAGLVAWALVAERPRRRRAWTGMMVLGAVICFGYVGHRWLRELQGVLEARTMDWMSGLRQRALEDRMFDTSIGELGALKLSGHIVLRVEPKDPRQPPRLLREAAYNQFNSGKWAGRRTGFASVTRNQQGVWELESSKTATQSVTIACTLLNGSGMVPVPRGAASIKGLPQSELEKSRLGSIRTVSGPSAVRYLVRYDPEAGQDGPPNELDLKVPDLEGPGLRRLANKLRLDEMSPEEAVKTVTAFFRDRFEYATYVKPKPADGYEAGTPLLRFLFSSRAGHCEYFATGTALLLREAGVPTRYVTGYAITESSRNGRSYVIRERHGHAWIVAWVNGVWRELDTTPPSWSSVEEKRASMFEPLLDAWSGASFRFAELRWLLKTGALVPYLAAALAVLVLILIWRVVRHIRKSAVVQTGDSPQRLWPGIDSEFYQIEKRLAELGLGRNAGETFGTWLHRVALSEPSRVTSHLFEPLLALHYRYRFDPKGLDRDQRMALNLQVRKCLDALA